MADQVHARTWAWLRGLPLGEHLWSQPSTRTLVLAGGVVALCLALTATAPLLLLVASPLLFGVPHVVADLRYLALRPPRPVPRPMLGLLALPFLGMTVLRLVLLAGGPGAPRLELLLGAGAVALAASWAPHRIGKVLAALVLAALVPALAWPREAALLFGHVHNFVAVGLWCLFVGERRVWGPLVGLLTAALAVVGLGALDPLLAVASPIAGQGWSSFVATLAPDLPDPWATRLVAAFTLMQAVHYGMWLVCIPDAARGARPAPPSTRWAAYLADLGPLGVGLVVAGAAALLLAAGFQPMAARNAYLSLVLFHGWLELAIGAHLISSRGPRLAPV